MNRSLLLLDDQERKYLRSLLIEDIKGNEDFGEMKIGILKELSQERILETYLDIDQIRNQIIEEESKRPEHYSKQIQKEEKITTIDQRETKKCGKCHKTKKLIMFGRYESKGNYYIKAVCLKCEEKYIKRNKPEKDSVMLRKVGTDMGVLTEIWIDLEAYLFQGSKGIRIADSFLQQIEKVVLFIEKKKKVFEEVDLGIPENK
jgi:hypothetical protein